MPGIVTACEKCCGSPNKMDRAMDRDRGIGLHMDTADMVYVYDKKVYRGASV